MKAKLIASFLLACCIHSLSAKSEFSADSTAIVDYFLKYLEGEKSIFSDNGGLLKISQVEDASRLVWDAWRSANSLFDEDKILFIDVNPLSNADSSRIIIPESLEKDAVMTYYLGSKGDKPDEGFPLFIYTHGSGPKAREWATGLKICREFADTPSVYFIPRIPNEGEYYRWWQKGKQYVWEKALRQAMLADNINPDRIYVFGISEGGYGSQRLASFYADYLAAAGPMAGGEPLSNAPAENLGNIAFSLRTGADDRGFYRMILTENTGKELDSLQSANPGRYTHWVELIPGYGHSIDYKPTTPWLKQFSRSPHPRQVTWENFEMDGIKRNRFYNLAVSEPDTLNQRTRYDLNIEGNIIYLDVNRVEYETTERDPNWGIPLKSRKHFTPATEGEVTIYLNSSLVDLEKEITVFLKGNEVFKGKVEPTLANLVNSCAIFYDSRRLFPASITVKL